MGQAAQVKSNPEAIVDQIRDLLRLKKSKAAQALCVELNQQYPDFAAGWQQTSELALLFNNAALALAAIDKALALMPETSDYLLQRANCLARLGRLNQAEPLLLKLHKQPLTDAYLHANLALLLSRLDHNELAKQHYQQAIALQPKQGQHHYNLATVLRFLGDSQGALNHLSQAIHLQPNNTDAYYLRSQLRTVTADNHHINQLTQVLARVKSNSSAAMKLHYSLAKEYEDINQHHQAWQYFNSGANIRRANLDYQVQQDVDIMAQLKNQFDADFFAKQAADYENDEPIFILGMPRTGSTLVERIIGSHSDVYAAGELTNFAQQMMLLLRGSNPKLKREQLIQQSVGLDLKKLGQSYIASTRPRTGHCARFIDKLPLNFLYIGLIKAALPNAKIIHVQRHPIDTCFAIYKTLFENMYPFSYALDELAQYYIAYQQLMQHWQRVIPGGIYSIAYEDVVNNLEGQAQALIKHCQLDWQAQCVHFYKNTQATTTASASQVRRELYASSINRWQHHDTALQPLICRLRDAGVVG